MTKLCAECRQSLPWVEFWAAAKWPDGSMRRPQSYCKDCVKARRRARRETDPEGARAVDRRDRERLRADPEQAARRRETQRENSASHRRRHGALTWAEYLARRGRNAR
jgi:hypothetical protein